MSQRIGYLVGSLAKGSINRSLMNNLIALADDGSEFVEVPIDRLPLYDHELDDDYPPVAFAFKEAIRGCDGLIFATPEYNRSIPGSLKNAIDWGSRPSGESAFSGIPAGVVSASVGAPGGALAQQHLRNILAYLDMPTMGQPEVFIQYTSKRFHSDGTLIDDSTREFLSDWMSTYLQWVGRLAPVRSAA